MQKNPQHRSLLSLATCPTARHFALGVLSLITVPGLTSTQAQATAPNVTYSGPLVITQGGTYSGNFRSNDSSVPVIMIQTTQPVIIENCILAGAGDLIDAKGGGVTLTVRNNKGYGLVQSADNVRHGRFVEANSAKSVTIEHNYFESTSGITIYQWGGNGTAQQTLTVRYNSAKNIDGRYRNGGRYLSQFLQQNGVHNLVGCEIAWNQIINEPNKSLVEDNISFYNSGGSANSPDLLHDNYVQGAFPYPATAATYNGTGFIIDGDATPANASAYVKAYRNQVVGTCGAALNIAGGHDIQYSDNRVISSGMLPDGTRLPSGWAAGAIWNAYSLPSTAFYNNTWVNNYIGYYHAGGNTPYANRQDYSPGLCGTCTGTVYFPNRTITVADEQAEWTFWQQKLSQNGVAVGPGGGSASTPAPSPAPAPAPAPAPTPAPVPAPTTTGPQVSSYTLVNASTNTDIMTLASGATLNLATLPTRNLNIRANTTAGTVGSVILTLNGAATKTQTESLAPYALFSDNSGAYNSWTPVKGTYSLSARTYTAAGGTGTAGTALAISFTVTDQATAPAPAPTPAPAPAPTTGPQVTSFTLVNADTDTDIMTITAGTVLKLGSLPTRNLNIRANATGAASVVFALSGAASRNQTESTAPYALFSDYQSNYYGWTPVLGSYSLTARGYTAAGGSGTAGTAATVSFSVTN